VVGDSIADNIHAFTHMLMWVNVIVLHDFFKEIKLAKLLLFHQTNKKI